MPDIEAFVVDASISVKSCLGAGFASLVDAGRLVAPALLWSETTSTLRELTYRGEISAQAGVIALSRLVEAPIDRVATSGLYRDATFIARRLGWAKTYDAEYVALALARQVPLVTVDRRLAAGASGLVRVIAPPGLADPA